MNRRLHQPLGIGKLLLAFLCAIGGLMLGSAPLPAQDPPVPQGDLTFVELFHIQAEDALQFMRDAPTLKRYVDEGIVTPLTGKPRSLMIIADDATTQKILEIIRAYENLEVRDRVTMETISIKYANVLVVLEALAAMHICQVWHRTEEVKNDSVKSGNKTVTHTYKRMVYAKYDAAKGDVGLAASLPEVPYVLEIPHTDPIDIPPVNMGQGYGLVNELSLDFPESPSTESRNRIVAVGTPDDLERIREAIGELDQPARQIMIECQIIELQAAALTDLGIDVAASQKRHNVINFASPLPGEPIPQPSESFEPITQSGLSFLFDDQAERMSGKFLAGVHVLVRNGDAIMKARPKLYCLDDRQNLIHIGEEVPTFISTQVNRDVGGGNFVEEVNQVGKQYVGITLNVKPRVSGREANEISMLVDIQINNLLSRERVFEEDLLGVPTVAVRKFRGQARVKNHRPLILGGLIREDESSAKTKIPVVGDLPLVGPFLGRTTDTKQRREIIIVMTPHILSESGIDPVSTPKESLHFDTFNSVLFNDRYIMKGRDLVGLDPISGSPVEGFTESEVLDLTLLHIVKKRELVRKLRIFDEYLPEAALGLSIFKRNYPEKSLRLWGEEERKLYFQAGAILVENIKSLNPGLTYQELTQPRREIVIPTSPYHVSLSYDKLKTFYEKGEEVVWRSSANLSEKTVELLSEMGTRSLREFGEFMKIRERTPGEHGQLREELTRLYGDLFPQAVPVDDLAYPDFFVRLAEEGLDFTAIATHFRGKLESQPAGTPVGLGFFEGDLAAFKERTVSLEELAERLQHLDTRWRDLNTSSSRPVQGL